MTSDDFRRLLFFSPEGLFIASNKGDDLGMVASTSYGECAWIGNLVVLPEVRGRGIGTALMKKALNHLAELGAKSIRLDGVQRAIPLYRRLGFKREYWSLRYLGEARIHVCSKTRPMTLDDLETVAKSDQSIFKAPRQDMTLYNLEHFPDLAYTAWSDGNLIGYIMAKHGEANVKIGPWLCLPGYREYAEELLFSVMNEVEGKEIWVGLPEGNEDGVAILEANGFTSLPSSLRMCYGDCGNVEIVEAVYGLGSPDKG